MTRCEQCKKYLDAVNCLAFCDFKCLNQYKNDYFNYNVEEYVQEHLDGIVQEYRKDIKEMLQ